MQQDRITRIYNRNSPLYDWLDGPNELLVFRRLRPHLLAGVHGRTLEVGVGTGRNLPYYPPGVEAVGVDAASGMLERARRRNRKCGAPIELQLADVRSLPFEDGVFDVVLASFVFCSVADPVAGLRELRRVLRPRGELRLLEHQRPQGRLLGRLFDLLNPLMVRLTGANINRRTDRNVERAGFVEVGSQPMGAAGILRLIRARREPIETLQEEAQAVLSTPVFAGSPP